MQLNVRGRNLPLEPAIVHLTQQRMTSAVRRYEPSVRRADVRLADLNGPRGGIDQRCRVSVQLSHHGPSIVAEATDARMEVAIDRAAQRLTRQLRRHHRRLAQRGERRRGRVS